MATDAQYHSPNSSGSDDVHTNSDSSTGLKKYNKRVGRLRASIRRDELLEKKLVTMMLQQVAEHKAEIAKQAAAHKEAMAQQVVDFKAAMNDLRLEFTTALNQPRKLDIAK